MLLWQSHSYGCTYIPVSLKHFPEKPEGSLLSNSTGEHKQFSKSIRALWRETHKHCRKKGSLGVAGRLWSSEGVFSLPWLYRAAADVGKQLNCLSQYIPFRFQSGRAIPIPRWQAQQLCTQDMHQSFALLILTPVVIQYFLGLLYLTDCWFRDEIRSVLQDLVAPCAASGGCRMLQIWAGNLQVSQLSQLQSLVTIPISSPGGAGLKVQK